MLFKEKKNKSHSYTRGVILGFKRSLRHQDVSKVRIKIPNTKKNTDSSFFLGKKVMYLEKNTTTTKKKIVWGKIVSLHGRSGSFIVKFIKNLTPSSITDPVFVTMLSSKEKI